MPRPWPIGFDSFGSAAWIDNRYKLVHNTTLKRHLSDTADAPIDEWELYDIINDGPETTNIAHENPNRVQRLKNELKAWQNSTLASSQGRDY